MILLRSDGLFYCDDVANLNHWKKIRIPSDADTDEDNYLSTGEIALLPNDNESSHLIEFSWENPVNPNVCYRYDLRNGTLRQVMGDEPEKRINEKFKCERVYINGSNDGDDAKVSIPITIIRNTAVASNHNNFLVMAYGAYGLDLDLGFSIKYLPLLHRGFNLAFVHIRGGGELGKGWYESGRLFNKKNGIKDLKDACRWLQSKQRSSLVGLGISAGAVPFACLYNDCPELFKGLLLRVPLLDPYSLMQLPNLPLNTLELQEWGNVQQDPLAEKYLRSYSPTLNINASDRGPGPGVLISASMQDERIPFWQPLEWIQKHRLSGSNNNDNIYLYMGDKGGHFGLSGSLGQISLEWSFALSFDRK